MRIKFWGVRGSTPSPGPHTVKYGGNTLCLELGFEDLARTVIIDAGTGIRELGNYLLAQPSVNGSLRAEIFLTHTHLDHIIGFPFFAPIYLPDTCLKIYGPMTCEDESLENVLGGQLSYRYFPVRQAELAAQIEYVELMEGRFELGDGIELTTKYMNHPLLCLGYRFKYRGKLFCTAYDTEPFRNLFMTDPADPSYDAYVAEEGERAAREENDRMEEFIRDADLLIYDAQYTQREYESNHVGWGHSPMEYAISAAGRSNVKQLALIHHDPMRTDLQIDQLCGVHCEPDRPGNMVVFFAREGMEVRI